MPSLAGVGTGSCRDTLVLRAHSSCWLACNADLSNSMLRHLTPLPACACTCSPCRLAVEQRRAQDREEVVRAALAAVREWRAARQQA